MPRDFLRYSNIRESKGLVRLPANGFQCVSMRMKKKILFEIFIALELY